MYPLRIISGDKEVSIEEQGTFGILLAEGRIFNDTELIDANNTKMKAIEFHDYKVVKYDFWMYGQQQWYLYCAGGSGLIFVIYWLYNYSFVNYDFLWRCALLGAVTGAFLAVRLYREARKIFGNEIRSNHEYIMNGIIICSVSFFGLGAIPTLNCLLDFNPPKERVATVRTITYEIRTGRKGRNRGMDSFAIVDSWRPDMKLIKIPANGSGVSAGDSILVYCRAGQFGIEYFDGSKYDK